MRSTTLAGTRSRTRTTKRLGNVVIDEVPLPEYRQDVLDPGTGSLAKDILAPDAIEVDFGRRLRYPSGKAASSCRPAAHPP